MNLYSNGERIIRATGKAYEAIYRAQGFRPYAEEIKEDKVGEQDNAGSENVDGEDKNDGKQPDKAGEPDNAGKANESGAGAADTGKGKKPAARRKPDADK